MRSHTFPSRPGALRAPASPGAASGRGANYLRTTLLMGGLTALTVVVADALGGHAWGAAALAIMAAVNLGTWWFSDRIVVAMHGARPLSVGEAPHVHAAVAELAARAGIGKPRLFLVRDPAPNAFATGRSAEHAVVAVTTGLVDLLDEREIRGVIAHELAHVLHRDTLIGTIAATMAGAISLLARLAGWTLMLGGGRHHDDEGRNPVAALLLVIVAPLIALLLQLAVSRSREYGADATGARLAGTPHGLASALAKLGAYSRRVPMRTADPAMSHLYIVAPLFGRGGRTLAGMFQTHPPIEERIRRLQAMA